MLLKILISPSAIAFQSFCQQHQKYQKGFLVLCKGICKSNTIHGLVDAWSSISPECFDCHLNLPKEFFLQQQMRKIHEQPIHLTQKFFSGTLNPHPQISFNFLIIYFSKSTDINFFHDYEQLSSKQLFTAILAVQMLPSRHFQNFNIVWDFVAQYLKMVPYFSSIKFSSNKLFLI